MNKIYLVVGGDFSSFDVCGIFSTEKKAKESKQRLEEQTKLYEGPMKWEFDIQTMTVNEESGMWMVTIDKHSRIAVINEKYRNVDFDPTLKESHAETLNYCDDEYARAIGRTFDEALENARKLMKGE